MTLGIILLILGLFLYILNIALIRFYLNKNSPEILDDQSKDLNGRYQWEYTAGIGVVPKWVSKIGLLSIPIFLLGLIFIIISLLK